MVIIGLDQNGRQIMNKYNVIVEERSWDNKIISVVVDARNISETALIEIIRSYNTNGFTVHIEEAENGNN